MTAQEKPRLKIGGALRFNYNYSDWKPESRNRGGEFDFDVLRLNVNASYKKIDLAVVRSAVTAFVSWSLRLSL